jgi:hypothetical protein
MGDSGTFTPLLYRRVVGHQTCDNLSGCQALISGTLILPSGALELEFVGSSDRKLKLEVDQARYLARAVCDEVDSSRSAETTMIFVD